MTDVTSGRFRYRPGEGDFVRYDGTNADAVAAFAGRQYEGTDQDGDPQVRGLDRVLATLLPDWVVSRADGFSGVITDAPAAWAQRCEEIPGQS